MNTAGLFRRSKITADQIYFWTCKAAAIPDGVFIKFILFFHFSAFSFVGSVGLFIFLIIFAC